MLKLFSTDINVVATAYIVAENEDEARALIIEVLTRNTAELLEESSGGFVRGANFKRLIDEINDDEHFTRVTISPAITLVGPCEEIDDVC